MRAMNDHQAERETFRAQAGRDELVERIARMLRADGSTEPLPGLFLFRADAPTELRHTLFHPAFCVIAQGCKEMMVGDTRYQYDPAHYLITTVELPVASQVTQASQKEPYLGLRLQLDPVLVGSVMVEADPGTPRRPPAVTAIDVSSLDAALQDAVVRLVRLLDSPSDMRFLAPLVIREIVYRLLMGEQGDRLRYVTVLGGNTHRIATAIERFHKEFDQPLRVDEIAHDLGMSVSGFHHHFKAVTAMSPLQFQKQLRLQEARRLMLGEHLDAASAGYRVGYDDASHFNREYKSLFGTPPLRDIERLREAANGGARLGMD